MLVNFVGLIKLGTPLPLDYARGREMIMFLSSVRATCESVPTHHVLLHSGQKFFTDNASAVRSALHLHIHIASRRDGLAIQAYVEAVLA